MPFTLPALPFAPDALEPHMSAETLRFHHGKHHAAYVKKTNELLAGTPLEGKSLEEVILAARKEGNQKLFNQAAQHWNHSFFWQCLSPAGGKPGATLAKRLDSEIPGGFESAFTRCATANFGSGWTWLVQGRDGKLAVKNTGNADLPLAGGETALLTLDVWEHAYYIDYRNERPKFIKAFLDHLVNWDFVAQALADAGKSRAAA
jgi:Fe-Mn family superoxide dismutase